MGVGNRPQLTEYGHPGISAEYCLVADLGIDPGATGMQSMEATQFMIPVILYEAATNPLEKTRMDTILLRDFPTALLNGITTLLSPAAYPLKLDQAIMDQLKALPEAPTPETESA